MRSLEEQSDYQMLGMTRVASPNPHARTRTRARAHTHTELGKSGAVSPLGETRKWRPLTEESGRGHGASREPNGAQAFPVKLGSFTPSLVLQLQLTFGVPLGAGAQRGGWSFISCTE